MAPELSVKEFYRGRSVLITGGTGFMGKVLVEKLLYASPEIQYVYLLMREKKGRSINARIEDMLRSPIFDRIKNMKKELLDKIIPINGHVGSEGLSMSIKDMAILSEEVSVAFHLAATTNMNMPLRQSVSINVIGTKNILDVVRTFKKLAILVHVSTAFCYPELEVLEEKFHKAKLDPRDIMLLCQCLDDKQLELISPSLLDQHPNTYTYTKRLAENLVYDAYSEVPCVIARPSIVVPAYRDPIPGWVEGLQGPAGLMLGAGKGVIRTMLCDGNAQAQVVPVDGAINALIAIAMIEACKKTKPDTVPVYNLNVADQAQVTWGEVLNIAKSYNRKNPTSWPLWYPNGTITVNRVEHEVKRILFHIFPAYLVDFLLLLAGQKRFLVKIQNKISLGLQLLQYFTMRRWYFPCPNYDAIHTILSKEDAELLITHKDNFDMEDYIKNAIETGRLHVLKEDPAKVPINRIVHNFLFLLDTTLKILFWCFVLSLLACWFEPIYYVLTLGKPVVKYLPFLGRTLESTN